MKSSVTAFLSSCYSYRIFLIKWLIEEEKKEKKKERKEVFILNYTEKYYWILVVHSFYSIFLLLFIYYFAIQYKHSIGRWMDSFFLNLFIPYLFTLYIILI